MWRTDFSMLINWPLYGGQYRNTKYRNHERNFIGAQLLYALQPIADRGGLLKWLTVLAAAMPAFSPDRSSPASVLVRLKSHLIT